MLVCKAAANRINGIRSATCMQKVTEQEIGLCMTGRRAAGQDSMLGL